ncbi:death-associated inhibitor of apoptosis 1-like [Uloborus diversus]|uniref:death-associated inhibitor of apoptosis 1-like n=1 Tax=Uloborus diversus TaxID=327109 RepID=UPI002409034F|nr:death-associated inhibitor of apoptosis 1-like [Uloborus diversus]
MLSTARSEPSLGFANKNLYSDTCKGFKHSISINGDAFLSKNLTTFSDEPDNNTKSSESTSSSLCNGDLFETMKYEVNRLLSYKNKWPCNFIKSEELAEAGFFYLQVEDKVQCPFCHVIIYSWKYGDKPLREHMKKFPKCPFLMSVEVGNIPITRNNSPSRSKLPPQNVHAPSTSFQYTSYKPKHPKMADIQRRLLSFKEWPLVTIEPDDLAECGLYYTGIADVVTCFFCGGSLGNWEVDDDPWEEHSKHFGQCLFLSLAKRDLSKKKGRTYKAAPKVFEPKPISSSPRASFDSRSSRKDFMSELYDQACEIFPEPLVLEVLAKNKTRTFTSLSEICEEILHTKEQKEIKSRSSEPLPVAPAEINTDVEVSTSSAGKGKNNAFLCKICMDHDMEVVFQPCGHFLSCQKCSHFIFDCPLCRKPIISKVRAYLS